MRPGQLGCILCPTEPPWVGPSRGAVSHFPRPGGLSGRCLPLRKASFVLRLAALHNPLPPLPCRSRFCWFQGHRLEAAPHRGGQCVPPPEWSAVQKAGAGFLASSVPCPLRALALPPPQVSGAAPPPCLGCGCAASRAWGAAILDVYQEGGRFGCAHSTLAGTARSCRTGLHTPILHQGEVSSTTTHAPGCASSRPTRVPMPPRKSPAEAQPGKEFVQPPPDTASPLPPLHSRLSAPPSCHMGGSLPGGTQVPLC